MNAHCIWTVQLLRRYNLYAESLPSTLQPAGASSPARRLLVPLPLP